MSGHKSDLLSAFFWAADGGHQQPKKTPKKTKTTWQDNYKNDFSFAFAIFTAKFSFDFAVNVKGVLDLLCTGLSLFPKKKFFFKLIYLKWQKEFGQQSYLEQGLHSWALQSVIVTDVLVRWALWLKTFANQALALYQQLLALLI